MKLQRDFFARPTIEVAKELIGKFLVHKYKGQIFEAMIIETEAYAGFSDKACHGSRGETQRNQVMFGPAGFCYVYLIYGIYHCLNLTTEKQGYPSAVLIRGLDFPNADGPGKLCREFKISKNTHNGLDITKDILWVEDRGKKLDFQSGPRIGVDYAGDSAKWPWRFYIK